MEIIADLQIHSRHSRATSKNINFDNLEKYAKMKGIGLLGTGDFQHPEWNKEIKEKLKEDDKGILRSKTGFPFLWQTEISLMFSQNGRRAVHLVILAPNCITADKIIEYLSGKGRLDYDGRPIFGMTCRQAVKELKEIDDRIEIIPAHAFTPWFGVYGSDSGFDSLLDCFGELTKHIYAIESGMSADPEMAWRLKENVNVVSFSDAHSMWPWRLGREATIFELEDLSYDNIIKAIRTGNGLKATIETPPEYGKYHWDGHRNCDFSCSPEETEKLKGICPKCNKGLTIGVESRINKIAKEKQGYKPENARPFYKLTPLHEMIAFHLSTNMLSGKRVWGIYDNLIRHFGNEFNILLKVSKEELIKTIPEHKELVELILLNREGKLEIKPGYDGVYGKIVYQGKESKFNEDSSSSSKEGDKEKSVQKKLF